MYKIEAIILKKTRIWDKKILISLLTEEYGRVTSWCYKKECSGDIGSLCEVVLYRKNSINIVQSIMPRWSPLERIWKYKELISYLEILRVVSLFSMENSSQSGIISDYKAFVESINGSNTELKLTLFLCRFMKQSGILSWEFFETSKELKGIYTHIDKTPIERVLYSEKIQINLLPSVQSSIRYSLLSWNPNSLFSL